MQKRHVGIIALLLITACFSGACAEVAGGKTKKAEPYTLETVAATGAKRMTLTAKAAERLNIQVAVMADNAVPYSAVLYALNGDTFVYTNPEPLTFLRAPIVVDRVEAGMAVLSDGPSAGTPVVTVGAAELYGIDAGIGK